MLLHCHLWPFLIGKECPVAVTCIPSADHHWSKWFKEVHTYHFHTQLMYPPVMENHGKTMGKP